MNENDLGMLIRHQHPISKRWVIFEDDGTAAYLYLTERGPQDVSMWNQFWYNIANGRPIEMATVNVSLTPEMELLVSEKVSSGMYVSASDVVDDALRLLKEQHHLRQLSSDDLKREVTIGTEQLACGEAKVFHCGEELAAHIEAEGHKLLKARRTAE